jgi:TetR/AcrR family transcriptional regulator, transcriptional repressor for nem operon
MPRRKSFAPADAVRAARDRFWERGYEATSLADLESVTGLNRSSLYQAFGPKRELFALALDSYLTEVAWPRLAPIEAPGAGPTQVAGYFRALARVPHDIARRGCLVVNTITELGPHDRAAHAVAMSYRERIRGAFAQALTVTMPARTAARRADVLTGLLIGVLATMRLDPDTAADLARAAATEIDACG